MSKIFYVGKCPVCWSYGRLEVDKDVTNNEYIVICEECLAEWKTPQDALRNANGQRRSFTGGEVRNVRNATYDEIKELGWDRFIVEILEE